MGMDKPSAQAHGAMWMCSTRGPSHLCQVNILPEDLYSSLQAAVFSSGICQFFELESQNHRILRWKVPTRIIKSNSWAAIISQSLSTSFWPFLAGILPGRRYARGAQGLHSFQGTFQLYFTFMWTTVSGTRRLVRTAIEDNSPSQYRALKRLDFTCLLSLHSYTFTNRFLSLF